MRNGFQKCIKRNGLLGTRLFTRQMIQKGGVADA